MTSSWDSYYIVFLSAILSLCIPASLAFISFIFFPKNKLKDRQYSKLRGGEPNRTILGQRINVRFFLAANAALILITLALELVPCATTVQSENQEGLIKGLISIVTLAGFSVLGLLYSIRKGDMGWLSSFNTGGSKEKKSG
jgi:NADH:ubiquinone oxidoreductase subunit 3 (subunit A)